MKTIEGIFSGTLSYLFNEYKPGMKFSDVRLTRLALTRSLLRRRTSTSTSLILTLSPILTRSLPRSLTLTLTLPLTLTR